MKEPAIMMLHYITGGLIIIFGTLHLYMRIVKPFAETIAYYNILGNYRNVIYVLMLELLLITVALHGFNGLRIILIEWRQGGRWEKAVTWTLLIVGLIVVALGTRTVIQTNILE